MKVRIVKRTYNGNSGYYIRYKKFLFWHTVWNEKCQNGDFASTDKFGESYDIKHYFNTFQQALEYVEKTKLGEVIDTVMKEIEI